MAEQRWVEDKLKTWVAELKHLARFARVSPQITYYGLTVLLHEEWQFFQHATPGIGPFFAPLRAELRDDFLLDLLWSSIEEAIELLCKWITWGVNLAGIGIPDPTQITPTNFETLEQFCEIITDSVIK